MAGHDENLFTGGQGESSKLFSITIYKGLVYSRQSTKIQMKCKAELQLAEAWFAI